MNITGFQTFVLFTCLLVVFLHSNIFIQVLFISYIP